MLFILPSIIVGFVLFKPDVSTVVQFAVKSLFLLAAIVFLLHVINRIRISFASSDHVVNVSTNEEKVHNIRKQTQDSYNDKAVEFHEKTVLRKREKDRKRFESLMKGRPFAGSGQQLGSIDQNAARSQTSSLGLVASDSSSSQEVRELQSESNANLETEAANKDKDESFLLPDEPESNAENSVVIAIKTTHGKTYKRRFFKTDRVEILLNYMISIGYHPKHYGLYFSYPRKPISEVTTATLEEVEIIHDVLLNVEEKE